jgi:hypothetical protein
MATELHCPLCGEGLKAMDEQPSQGGGHSWQPAVCDSNQRHIWLVSDTAQSIVLTRAKG